MNQMHMMAHATTMNIAMEATRKTHNETPKNNVDIESFRFMMMMKKWKVACGKKKIKGELYVQ